MRAAQRRDYSSMFSLSSSWAAKRAAQRRGYKRSFASMSFLTRPRLHPGPELDKPGNMCDHIREMKMKSHNFWYAVNNTEVLVMPQSSLETFGATNLCYHMISELMDSANQIRIREGAILSSRPQLITPSYYENELLEGFGDQARQYVEWLRNNAKDLLILQYGFKLQKREINEHVVTGSLTEISERVKAEVAGKNEPMAAVLTGVDDSWDVCLLKLWVDVVRNSAPKNIAELGRNNMLADDNGLPKAIRADIEKLFTDTARNPGRLNDLYTALRRFGLFSEYEDRFFALVRQIKGQP